MQSLLGDRGKTQPTILSGAPDSKRHHKSFWIMERILNAKGEKYADVLQAYCKLQHVVAILKLYGSFWISNGADVNAQGGKYGNALQAAAYSGNPESMRMLLVGVGTQGERCGNALQAAASHGNVEAMQHILENGADVAAPSGERSGC